MRKGGSKTLQEAKQLHQAGRFKEAEALYKKALNERPGDAEALHLSGMLAYQCGDPSAAIQLIRKAIAANAAVADFHNNLGLALQAMGDLESSEASYKKALRLRPAYPEAFNNLGIVYTKLRRLDDAIGCFKRAIELKGDYANAHNNLGNACKESGRLEDAEASYEKAVSLNPRHLEAYNGLGSVYAMQNKSDMALDCFRRALSLDPRRADIYKHAGDVLKVQGRFDEAMDHFLKAVQLDPTTLGVYRSLVTCRKFTAPDDDILRLIEAYLSSGRSDDDDAMDLHFSLGKIYDDLHSYEKAFYHYQKANAIEHAKCGFDRKNHENFVQSMISLFTAETMKKAEEFGSSSDMPILIVGMPRSGTTLTEQILASHPLVFGAGELTFWGERMSALLKQGVLNAENSAEAAGAYTELLRSMAPDAKHVTDKMPANFMYVGLIHIVFPKAKILHCVRDPRDICLSIYFKRFSGAHPYSYDLEDLAFYYRQYLLVMEHWKTVLPAGTMMEVNYEALINDPDRIIPGLLEFCGLPWDDKCLEFYKTDRNVRTASAWQVRQPIYKDALARWKNYAPFLGPLADLAGD